MSHYAYTFDDATFHKALAPLLDRAFEDRDTTGLLAFLSDHRTDWRAQLDDTPTTQELARLAITALCGQTDLGIGDRWRQVRASLSDLYPEGRVFVTGNELRHFSGLYYQSAAYVTESARIIETVWHENRTHAAVVEPVRAMLTAAAQAGHGLLVEAR